MSVSKRMIGAVLLCVLWSPSATNAQSAREQARALFREGNQCYDQQDYEGALQRFRQAAKLYPSYKIDLNIANTLDVMGRKIEAVELFELFLERASTVAPREAVRAARQRFEALQRQLVSVQILCTIEGADIIVDQKPAGVTPLGRGIYLEPGTHRIAVTKQGYKPFAVDLYLEAGEQRELTVPLRAVPPMPPPAAQPPIEIVQPAPEPAGLSPSEQQRRHKTIWAWASLGTGSALVVTAVILYGVGLAQGNDAHQKYRDAGPGEDITGHWDDVESAKTKLVAGHVIIGLGAAAMGLSLYHFLTRPPEEPSTTVGLSGSAGGAALWVRGRF